MHLLNAILALITASIEAYILQKFQTICAKFVMRMEYWYYAMSSLDI